MEQRRAFASLDGFYLGGIPASFSVISISIPGPYPHLEFDYGKSLFFQGLGPRHF
jgi:hypothetical protein